MKLFARKIILENQLADFDVRGLDLPLVTDNPIGFITLEALFHPGECPVFPLRDHGLVNSAVVDKLRQGCRYDDSPQAVYLP